MLQTKRIFSSLAACAILLCGAVAFAETPDELVARLSAKYQALKSFQLTQVTKLTSASDSTMGTSKTWVVRDGGKMKMRTEVEMSQTMKGNESMKNEYVLVSDGTVAYREMTSKGKKSVTKMAATKDSLDPKNYPQMFAMGETTVKGSDTVEGQKCTLVEVDAAKSGMGSKLSYWFSDDTGLLVKLKGGSGPLGEMDVVVKDVKTNVDIPAEKFTYTPPADVVVTDMSKLPVPGTVKQAAPEPSAASPAATATPAEAKP